jgi:hypothetical protein
MKKKKQKIQYLEIPITKESLNKLASSFYMAITDPPVMIGDKISINIYGLKEVVLKFKVVKDNYSFQELRDLLNKK